MTTARTGKIGQLPFAIREELNRRILDGEQGPSLLPWLNGLAETVSTAAAKGWGNPEITDGNLSQWRQGGYTEWCLDWKRVQRVERTAEVCLRLAHAAGGSVSTVAADILAGQILEAVATMDDATAGLTDTSEEEGEPSGPDVVALAMAAASLSKAETSRRKLTLDEKKLGVTQARLEQLGEEIGLKKIVVARKFVEFLDDAKAREMAESARADDTQLPLLADYLLGVPDIEKLKR